MKSRNLRRGRARLGGVVAQVRADFPVPRLRAEEDVLVTKRVVVVGAAAAAVVLGVSMRAEANTAGVIDRSGIVAGQTCITCHAAGGAVPTVAFEGPASMTPGQTAQFKFKITTTLVRGGLNVASSANGATLAAEAAGGTRLMNNQITQTQAKNAAAGVVEFTFTASAPNTVGSFTLYGAGLAADNAGGNTGDGVATATKMVTVANAPAADAGGGGGGGGGADAGGGGGGGGGGDGDGDGTGGGNADPRDPLAQEPDPESPSGVRTTGFGDDESGCNSTGRSSPAGAVMIALTTAAALVAARKKRR